MTPKGATGHARPRRSLILPAIIVALLIGALLALGTWQIQRLVWKRALIARVDARVNALPVPAPGPAEWPALTREHAEYRHVRITGRWLDESSVRTQSATMLGSGFWLMTPLRTDTGTILINRGFVPPGWSEAHPPAGPVTVTGLLRITEPGGGFLRRNDPAAGRWYSRDVAAIAAAQRLGVVAPYFIDAADTPGGPPVGGLTVIAFPNNHLVYATTWYALALMLVAGWVMILRYERHPR